MDEQLIQVAIEPDGIDAAELEREHLP